jgi:DNA-binding LacI/PurR family transcriptional regulator
MDRPAGIRDVAVEAGVSHQTVSRVLNNHPSVSAGTRTRVIEAIHRLNYVAHNGARSLRSKRSRTIGVLISADANPIGLGLLPGLEAELRRQGMWMTVGFSSRPDDTDREMHRLREAAVDGVIVITTDRRFSTDDVRKAHRVPALYVGPDHDPGDETREAAAIAERAVGMLLTLITAGKA